MGGDSLVPMKMVREKTGLAPSSIYELISKGRFPKQIALTPRCVRWSQHEIDEWIDERKAGRGS
jgi:prophage regulatory protein